MSFECSNCHSKNLVCDEVHLAKSPKVDSPPEAKIACTNCLHYEWI